MNPSISTKVFSFGIAAVVTLTIMLSLDAMASAEQRSALAAADGVTQSACTPPAGLRS
jgi:hypothetical protein